MATDGIHLRRSRRRLCGESFKVPLVPVGSERVVVSTCMLRGSFRCHVVLMHDVARLGATVVIEHLMREVIRGNQS